MKALICVLMLVACPVYAQPVTSYVTSDDWVRLVLELQSKKQLLDNDDRKFLFRMINILTAKDDAQPDAAQRKWILDIERRLRAEK